jgi:ribosomal protein S18 acetylase RimI-like enzyme
MGIRIRPARPDDIDAMLALWAQSDVEPTVTDDQASLRRLLAYDSSALLVAVNGGRVAGTLIATWDGWRGSMWRLAVRADYRRHGIARALVAAGERRLRALGATRIATFVVTTDDIPSAFWAACGYQAQTGRRRFVKNLDPPRAPTPRVSASRRHRDAQR